MSQTRVPLVLCKLFLLQSPPACSPNTKTWSHLDFSLCLTYTMKADQLQSPPSPSCPAAVFYPLSTEWPGQNANRTIPCSSLKLVKCLSFIIYRTRIKLFSKEQSFLTFLTLSPAPHFCSSNPKLLDFSEMSHATVWFLVFIDILTLPEITWSVQIPTLPDAFTHLTNVSEHLLCAGPLLRAKINGEADVVPAFKKFTIHILTSLAQFSWWAGCPSPGPNSRHVCCLCSNHIISFPAFNVRQRDWLHSQLQDQILIYPSQAWWSQASCLVAIVWMLICSKIHVEI